MNLFGSHVRICVGVDAKLARRPSWPPTTPSGALREIHDSLSRFRPESDLCKLNRRSERSVEVSPLIAQFLVAAHRAFELSGGLVDASVIGAVEASGYRRSRVGVAPASLRDALAAAPPRRAALPGSAENWETLSIDVQSRILRCDPEIRFDSGGIGKGLAADLCAACLGGLSSFAVDCGGDLRVGGDDALERSD